MRIDLLMFCFVPIVSVVGAVLSRQLKLTQNNVYLFMIPIASIFTSLTWALISKYTKISLSVATIIFDSILSISYFLAFVFLGEAITTTQIIGVILAITSMVLLST